MKKAILVISFGSSDIDAVNKTISIIEKEIALEFKDYDVIRAFTSHRIIRKIKAQNGEVIKTPEEALEELKNLGYKEVIIQPLHIIAGEEYDYIKRVIYDNKNNFENLLLGRPIFYYGGANGTPNDYIEFINAVEDEILKGDKAVVLFGHGTAHPSNSAYGCLQNILSYRGYDNVFITTLEAYPKFEDLLTVLKRKSIKEVKVIPLLLLAGHHVKKDMASNKEKSLKTYLEDEGISVEVLIKGLGEIKKFRELYILRIKDVINGTYDMIGKTKKYMKN